MKTDKRLTFNSLLAAAFLVLIFSLGFMQPYLTVSHYKIPATDLIFLFVFALWAAAVLLKKIEFRRGVFYLPVFLYLLALALSVVFSSSPKTSLLKFLGEIYLVGLSVLAFNLARSVSTLKKTIFVWLAASGIGCAIGAMTVVLFYLDRDNPLLNYTLHYYGSLPPGNYPRIQGAFLYPSMLCNYLTVSFSMLFAAFKLGWIGRAAFLILLFLFAVGVAFTITPGIGGVLLGAGLWFWLDFKEKERKFLAGASIVAGSFAAFLFLLVSTFTTRNVPTSPYRFELPLIDLRIDPTQRLLTWQSAWQTFLDYPFFGRGLGTDAARVAFLDPSGNLQTLTDAHQTWLNVAAQSGVVGLAAICFVSVYFVQRALPLKFSGETSVLRICFGAAFIAAFLYQGLIGSFENARHLWVLIGLLGGVGESASGDGADRS